MAFSLVAWSELVDTGGKLTEIDAVLDQHVTTDGKDVIVPSFASNLVGVYAIGGTISGAQISSPTLRRSLLYDLSPLDVYTKATGLYAYHLRFNNPLALTPGEGLRALVAENAVAEERETVIVALQGEPETVPEGEIHTVKCTSTTTLTPYEWTLCPLSLTQQLEAGRYAIVGMRTITGGGIAARLVIPGSEYRPGVISDHVEGYNTMPEMRYGRTTVFGSFEHTFVPQVEFFSSTADTAQIVFLDVIKVE